MKKEFIGFYDPTEEEIDKAWKEGIFAFDANAILNLYRYTDVTRKDFLHALKSIKGKLFIPFQVAYEYLNNRVGVIDGLDKSYLELENCFKDNYENNLKKMINGYKRHPSIVIETIFDQYEAFIKKISLELEKQKRKHPDFKAKDYILDELTELFDSCVGKEPSKNELDKIYIEGKDRYAEQIPPGYKDLKEKEKKGNRHIYGDLLVWKELIEYSKKNKKLLIFVTDDGKEDWWKKENGKTIRPREELIKEFFDITGIRILIYNADQFLKFAKEKGLVPDLKDNTIEEVKSIRISDENLNYYYPLDHLNTMKRYMLGNDNWNSFLAGSNSLNDYTVGLDKINNLAPFFGNLPSFLNPVPPLQETQTNMKIIENLKPTDDKKEDKSEKKKP